MFSHKISDIRGASRTSTGTPASASTAPTGAGVGAASAISTGTTPTTTLKLDDNPSDVDEEDEDYPVYPDADDIELDDYDYENDMLLDPEDEIAHSHSHRRSKTGLPSSLLSSGLNSASAGGRSRPLSMPRSASLAVPGILPASADPRALTTSMARSHGARRRNRARRRVPRKMGGAASVGAGGAGLSTSITGGNSLANAKMGVRGGIGGAGGFGRKEVTDREREGTPMDVDMHDDDLGVFGKMEE